MLDNATSTGAGCIVREVVGVFPNAEMLDAAVRHLTAAGIHKSRISVLGTDEAVKARIGHLYRSVTEIEDDARAPRISFVSKQSTLAGEMTAVVVPLYIGGLLGAAAVAASGGALAAAVAALIVGSVTGGGIGGLLAKAVAERHANRIEEQIAQGGLVLWVQTPDQQSQEQALAALIKSGARDLHVHEIRLRPGFADLTA